jgi:hypothetical protein
MLKHLLQKILKHFQKTLINILTKNIGENILEKCESNVFVYIKVGATLKKKVDSTFC